MEELTFKTSSPCTMGVELELQILKSQDLDLGRDAADLLTLLEDAGLPGEIKPEITESMIELNSSVHTDYGDLARELDVLREGIAAKADLLNLRIAGGGAHPFHKWSERRIYPTSRFKFLVNRYGYLAKQFTVFGQHIHIGCASGDDAVYLTHMLTRYVPHFIALAAASPFFQGEDTQFQSSRLTSVNAFPLSGHIPFVQSWDEFCGYFRKMMRFGIVSSMKDFYWDIRPKPEYGTVELRICDTPLTVHRAGLLAAYAQTLAGWILHERPGQPSEDVYLVNASNRFEAARYGLEGMVVDPATTNRLELGQDVLHTLRTIQSPSRALRTESALLELADSIRRGRSDSAWLRKRFAETGSLRDVVRLQSDLWMKGGSPAAERGDVRRRA